MAIVVPVHRRSDAFTRCLAALRTLDPAPDELIVVVDGDDGEVAAEAAEAGARVVVQTPNAGPAVARNTGAARAHSDVVFFIDADVTAPPDAVRRVAEAFVEDPDLAAVIGSYDDRPPGDTLAAQYTNLRHHFVHQRAKSEGWTFWGACGAIRREVFAAAGGFDEDYVTPSIEDIELGYRLKAGGHRIRVSRDLQVTHLKRWTVRSLLKTDVVHRALPWSSLILRTRQVDDDLNVTLAERAKAALTVLAAGSAATAALRPAAVPGLVAAAALALVVAWDAPFLRFLARAGGPRVALFGLAWHPLYHLYSAAGFATAGLRHLVFGAQPVAEPWPGSPRRWLAGETAAHSAASPATDGQDAAPARATHPGSDDVADDAGRRWEHVAVEGRVARASTTVAGDVLLVRSRRVRRWAPVSLLVGIGLALLVAAPQLRDMVHVDGLSYLRIAEHYAAGDWDLAINGYWGPLYSWLLTPLLLVGVQPLVATEILQLAIGAATLVSLRRLCLTCGVRTATADGLVLVTVPLVLHLVFQNVYADLLLACLLLMFCSDLLASGSADDSADGGADDGGADGGADGAAGRTGHAWRAGAWAGLAFLTKPYALPVVVLVVAVRAVVVTVVRRREGAPGRRAAWRPAAVTLGTMALVVLPWALLVSWHYGEPTLSRAFGYNVAVVGPGSEGQPLVRDLVEPPHDGALSAWEDPSTMRLDADGWDVSSSSGRRLADNVGANLRDGAGLVVDQFLAVPLYAAAGAWFLVRTPWLRHPRDPREPRRAGAWLVLGAAVAVYVGGFLLTMVQARYLWFAVLALVPFAAAALDRPLLRPSLDPSRAAYPTWRLAGFALLAALVTVQAVAAWPERHGGPDVAALADEVSEQAATDGVELDGLRVASTGDWEASSNLCFHLDCTFLGSVDVATTSGAGGREAAGEVTARADVYLAWGGRAAGPAAAAFGEPVATVGALQVFLT